MPSASRKANDDLSDVEDQSSKSQDPHSATAGPQQVGDADHGEEHSSKTVGAFASTSISEEDVRSADIGTGPVGDNTDDRGRYSRSDVQADQTTMPAGQRAGSATSIELQPISLETLSEAIYDDLTIASRNQQQHDLRAGRWNVTARVAKLVVALAAALSSISLIGDNATLTATLSILTAAVAALNAAYDPPTASELHRRAARDYLVIARDLDLLNRRLPGRYGYYGYDSNRSEQIDPDELGNLYQFYLGLRSRLQEVGDGAPALNRLTRTDRDHKVGMLEFYREQRQMKWRLKLERARADHHKAFDELYPRPERSGSTGDFDGPSE